MRGPGSRAPAAAGGDAAAAAAAAVDNGGAPAAVLTPGLIHRVGPVMLPGDQRLPPSLEPYALRAGALRALLPPAAERGACGSDERCGAHGNCSPESQLQLQLQLQRRGGVATAAAASASELHQAYSSNVNGNGHVCQSSVGSASPDSTGSPVATVVAAAEVGGSAGMHPHPTYAWNGQDGTSVAGGGAASGVSVLNCLLSLSLYRGPERKGGAGPGGDGQGSGDAVQREAEAQIKAAKGGPFMQAFISELGHVRRFLRGSLEELALRLGKAAERLQEAHHRAAATAVTAPPAPLGGGGAGGSPHQAAAASVKAAAAAAAALSTLCGELRAECDEIGDKLVDLEEFERFNCVEFAELGLLYDKKIGAADPAAPPADVRVRQPATLGTGGGPRSSRSMTGAPAPATAAPAASADAVMGQMEIRRVYQRCLQENMLGGLTYDMVLVALSDVYEAVRHVHARNSSHADAPWVPPDQFKRSTTKFWVDPRDVLRVKATIVRHLPLLIFGRKSNTLLPSETSGGAAPAASREEPATAATTAGSGRPRMTTPFASPVSQAAAAAAAPPHVPASLSFVPLANGACSVPPPPPPLTPMPPLAPTASLGATMRAPPAPTAPAPIRMLQPYMYDSSKITSVYFDNKHLDVYHERLARGDGASLIRIRWYGVDEPRLEQNVFVERKKHRDAWTGECSLKERAQLPHREVPGFLAGQQVPAMQVPGPGSGQPPASSSQAKAATLLREVQSNLTQRKQEPYLRTEYRRTAFQLSSTNAVRISLDTQLTMTQEEGAPKAPGGWCRDPNLAIHRQDVVRFPYAVLEIKLQDEDSCPAWVLALRQSGLLVEAPKFSKFLHGMALLNPQRLRNTPHWFLPEHAPSPQHKEQAPQQQQQEPRSQSTSSKPASGWIRTALWLRGRPSGRTALGSRGIFRSSGSGFGAGGAAGPLAMSPATLEELADAGDKYAQEVPSWLFPANIRPEQAQDIIPDPDPDMDPAPMSAAKPHADVTATRGSAQPQAAVQLTPRRRMHSGGGGAAAATTAGAATATGQASIPIGPSPAEVEGADDVHSCGNNSKKSGGSSSSDYSRPSSVRSSYLPTVEAHNSLGPIVTRGSPSRSPPMTAADVTSAAEDNGGGGAGAMPPIRHGSGGADIYVAGASTPAPLSIVTVPSQSVVQSTSSRKGPESTSSGGGVGGGVGSSGSGGVVVVRGGGGGGGGGSVASKAAGDSMDGSGASISGDMGRRWHRRGRKGARDGGGGGGSTGSTAQLSALFAAGAAAAQMKTAVLAIRTSKRGRSFSSLKAAIPGRLCGLASPGENGPPFSRDPSGNSGSWIAAKWALLRRGGGGGDGGGGGGGGGGDIEAGPVQGGFELPRAAAMVRTRVEPKTFFAAERTFLSWLNIAVLVMFTSLSLMSDRLAVFGPQPGAAAVPLPDGAVVHDTTLGTAAPTDFSVQQTRFGCIPGGICQASQIAGMAMAPVAMVFMMYALYMYRKRSAQILRREAVRYDDQRGPVVLTCMLIVVLVIAYVLTVKSVS